MIKYDKKVYNKTYRKSHLEELKAYRKLHREEKKTYRKAHSEEIKAYNKEYTLTHKEEKKARDKAYRKLHLEESKNYCKTHSEEIKAQRKAYHKLHPEKSKNYRKANLEKRAAYTRKRKALKRGNNHEFYADSDIFERDGWICGICGQKINRRLKYPNPRSKSIDHIIPISKGGDDSPVNVQASHLRCNLGKHAVNKGQLRLFG